MGLFMAITIIIYIVIFSLHICFKDKPHSYIRLVRTIYIMNTIFLLSCVPLYFLERYRLDIDFEKASLSWLYNVLTYPGLLTIVLRMGFLPYIHTIIWALFYITYRKDTGNPKRETTLFIILSILSIIGCVFMELAYDYVWSAAFSI